MATKGKQQIRLGLSREFSVIYVSTRVDQNGDGVFNSSEKPSEEMRKQVEKNIRMVKSHHDSGREERQNSADEDGGFARGRNLSASNGDTETGYKTPIHSKSDGYGDSGKPGRRTDGEGIKAQSDKGSIAKQRGPNSKPLVTPGPESKPDRKTGEKSK